MNIRSNIQDILFTARSISVDDLLETEEKLKALTEAESAAAVKQVITSLPPRVSSIIQLINTEYDSVQKAVVNKSKDSGAPEVIAEFKSRIPLLPQLIDYDISVKLIVISELLYPYINQFGSKSDVDNAVKKFIHPVEMFVPLFSEKRVEASADVMRLSQEQAIAIAQLEKPDGRDYNACLNVIKEKRRALVRGKPKELEELRNDVGYQSNLQMMQEVKNQFGILEGRQPKEEDIPAINQFLQNKGYGANYLVLQNAIFEKEDKAKNTQLKKDPIFIRYSKFIEQVDAIKKKYSESIKELRDADTTVENKKVEKLKQEIEERHAATKVAVIKKATEDYYHYLMKVVEKELKDHPELRTSLQMQYSFSKDDNSMKNVPGVVLVAEKMHVIYLGAKGKEQVTAEKNTFSNLTKMVIEEEMVSKKDIMLLSALPETTQLALLKLQTVNELRNKLNTPNRPQTSIHNDAVIYLGDKDRQELLTTRRDNAGKSFLKYLASVGLVVTGQFSKLSQLWRTKGHEFLKNTNVPETKFKK